MRKEEWNTIGSEVNESLLAAWRHTILRIRVPLESGAKIVQIQPSSTTEGEFLGESPIHLVTAWNPGGLAHPVQFNEERQHQLYRSLDEAGVHRWVAASFDKEGDWIEEMTAVRTLSRDAVIRFGQQFGQLAIYEWSNEPLGLRIFSCSSKDVLIESGWSATTASWIPCPMRPSLDLQIDACASREPTMSASVSDAGQWQALRSVMRDAFGCDVCAKEADNHMR